MLRSVVVMACEARRKYFDYLKEELGNVPFSVDSGQYKNLWENCRASWQLHDKNSKWAITLQDDSIICKDFYSRLDKVLAETPGDCVVSLYAGERLKTKIDRSLSKGLNRVIDRKLYQENALCIPTRLVDDMIKFCDSRGATNDRKIQLWLIKNQIKVVYPIPSIVEHRSIPSEYRSRFKQSLPNIKRQAVWFIDDEYKNRELK